MAKSFTIEPDLLEYVVETRGNALASERISELLRRAMMEEQHERLEAEAAKFFAVTRPDRAEDRSFQKASLHTFSRN